MKLIQKLEKIIHISLVILTLSACSTLSGPQGGNDLSDVTRHTIVNTATRMLGTPYRYGGAGPNGFDCSGLVQYAYRSAGVKTPRTAKQQYSAANKIPLRHALPGDLVFFKIGRQISHVGIYIGNNRFVHAPSSGKQVETQSLNQRYYARRLVSAGRLAAP